MAKAKAVAERDRAEHVTEDSAVRASERERVRGAFINYIDSQSDPRPLGK